MCSLVLQNQILMACFFSVPQQLPILLELAASSSTEIVTAIIRQIRFLKPQWLERTFQFKGPTGFNLDDTSIFSAKEEDGSFDRTLIAYCRAYRVSTLLSVAEQA
jgi:hypothetical protein